MSTILNFVGGSGFIGTQLIKELKNNFTIFNFDKKKSSLIKTDIGNVINQNDLNLLHQNADWLILLAAEHTDNVNPISLYYDVNVKGAENILVAIEQKNINKIIFTSSVAVYGLNKQNPDESTPVDPFNHYGISKYQAEEILRKWYNQKPESRTLVIIRPTVVFGPENKGNVYNLLTQILKGKFKMVGSGNNKKSMTYVENITGFIKYILEKNFKGYHLFNYTDKPDLTTKELVLQISKTANVSVGNFKIPYLIGIAAGYGFDLLSKITRKKYSISSIRIKKFCATTEFSNKNIVEKTDFKAPYTLNEGLAITINHLLKNENF